MLKKIFDNSAQKLQGLLQALFCVTTGGGMLAFFIMFVSKFARALKYHQTGNAILDFVFMFLVPILFAFINYCGYLFFNMVLSFFTDVHEIRKSITKE